MFGIRQTWWLHVLGEFVLNRGREIWDDITPTTNKELSFGEFIATFSFAFFLQFSCYL